MKNKIRFISLLSAVVLLAGCTADAPAQEEAAASTTTAATTTAADIATAEAEDAEVIPEGHAYAQFSNGMPTGWECADGWSNGSMFNVTWRKRNVTFENERMQLIINSDITPSPDIPYAGGEFRSREFYGYGRYEVSMKPIKNDGVVSSFFTYTGPSDNNPWDEIDIEFLGKDTTIVQFNYFTDSMGGHEYIHELGFDAAEDFHTYAFEWHEDKIVWFVDGAEVYSATANIPVTPSKIMMNAWCGKGVDGWLNAFDDTNMPLTAEYEWVRFTPFG